MLNPVLEIAVGKAELDGAILTLVELCRIADTSSDVEASGAKEDKSVAGMEALGSSFVVVTSAMTVGLVDETWLGVARVSSFVKGVEDCFEEVGATTALCNVSIGSDVSMGFEGDY